MGWVIRLLNFIRYLPEADWRPVILTVQEEYYKENVGTDADALKDLPGDLLVVRTPTLEPKSKLQHHILEGNETDKLDTSKYSEHNLNSFKLWCGKLIKLIEDAVFIPDVKLLWTPFAVWRGWKTIRREQVDIIFVSAPYFSIIVTGCLLKWLTNCKLVIDFRDDWADNPYYRSRFIWGRWWVRFLEKKAVKDADAVLTLTRRSLNSFKRRYPKRLWKKYHFIPNGYDPRIEKIVAEQPLEPVAGDPQREFSIVHSGYLAWERNPEGLIQAVQELKEEHPALTAKLKIRFLGNVAPRYQTLIQQLKLEQWFEFSGQVPYTENIQQLAKASVLLLIPSQNAPMSLPGKLFEYLYLRRPMLVLCGDNATNDLLRELRVGYIAQPDDVAAIKNFLVELFRQFQAEKLSNWPRLPNVERFSRLAGARKLVEILSNLVK